MKKEDFLKLGLTEEQATAAAEASEKELKAYVPKEQYQGLEKQLADRDKDIADLKKSAGKDTEWKEKFENLETKYKKETEEMTKKLADTAKNNAVDMEILKAGGKNAKAIKALLDMDKINLKDDGTLEGLDLNGLKESDGYLFTQETRQISGTGVTKGTETGSEGIAEAFERAVMG